ncbi:MarR family winged helix-turn-helix transcriptional regulator [Streptomyces sp. NBC_00878]|uniref:MarR family winged helix-turn-helix transcriptional regulator n=1 Tax=Streptomyces sp. NBC_00878 TaxID=2975854 RepID=UPI002257DD8A|nr:MarR family transcriptional regulator [Streptomyces sp. NBC_00878]MCX4903455.1 MarR family transcriptional regulator [Streptomyces sp. NBC_00878]
MPSATPLNDPLISTFGRLAEAYNRLEQWLGSAMESETGLPHAWFEVLIRLARSEREQLTMSSLADQIALTSGGVTRLVDRMQTAGYVERRPCPTDRRVSYAGITAAGHDALERAATVHARNLRKAFDGFSARDLAALDAVLDRVRDSASALPRQP